MGCATEHATVDSPQIRLTCGTLIMTSDSRRPAKTPRKRRKTSSPQAEARMRQRAAGFRAARERNAAETTEDYVELIDELIAEKGEARPVDLADRLGVSKVAVTKTVQRLHRDEYVTAEPYRSIFLTPRGKRLAAACRNRHELVVRFLLELGIDSETAECDAEGIEHHVSDKTLAAMRAFVKKRRDG
jgi:DtxR family manganese transport transcriptional regulator